MTELERQLKDYRLTTAEIYYHFPDYPDLLQSYLWQEYDIAPRFPVLFQFLGFWAKQLDGKLHSVCIASKRLISASELNHYGIELTLH